jgi:hypothetical protein
MTWQVMVVNVSLCGAANGFLGMLIGLGDRAVSLTIKSG